MELSPYVDDLRRRLLEATALADADTREVVERLGAALDSAARLVLLDALSAAADEITREIAPGGVELRLRGREAGFVVTAVAEVDDPEVIDVDDTSTSRTTLRLPDALKARVDEAATADGVSVNTWLVRAVAAAVQPKQRKSAARSPHSGDSFAGWAR
ncbi:hisitidine kinase [Frondihabitans sp. PAMC 28766]|uniref:toxin-antitoxin system HicB family antitoxin n=1 Tax=Frondihabitans sp. PAMC 28766 TaxID=1795630 RepID=UPI00078C3AE6|nr:toxin-antitoxin system HicB family antitoxin [Frondihabitans sp. PAMC 28766]AMM20033.1 hisitidine kinase [Frondihabitans sp. PAMC 28766]